MALHARKRVTQWLMGALGPNQHVPQHAAAAAITAAQYAVARKKLKVVRTPLPAEAEGWLREVQRTGYCVVPGFYAAERCARSIAELERLYAAYPQFVQRKSDVRMFGVEAGSPLLAELAHDARLLAIAEHMLREPTVNAFTLGARIDYRPGNKGSGEGWHRDSFVVQFKAIVYLSDVSAEQGPFQLIERSQELPRLLGDMLQGRLGLAQNRIQDGQVAALLRRSPERLHTFTAAAGTLLLVDTSAIHRGAPIERDTRYALTNYYVQKRRAGKAMDDHFAPVLRAPLPEPVSQLRAAGNGARRMG